MTHAHDRTQLTQRLGFLDPDKKEPRHDRACQFLAADDNMRALLPLYFKLDPPVCSTMRVVLKTELEKALTKGSGQYATTLGFIDVATKVRRLFKHVRPDFQPLAGRPKDERYCTHCKRFAYGGSVNDESALEWDARSQMWTHENAPACLAVEVKIQPVSVAEVLRQVNFYREYIRADWVVATAYDLTEVDVQTLVNAQIKWIRLGAKFEAYVQDCKTSTPANPVLDF